MKRKGEGTETPIGKALRLQATTAKPSTSSPRNAEIRALFISFKSMFPNTETDYLEEMADELVGKPVATDRFVTELLARDSKPPDFWKPINKAISAALQDDPRVRAVHSPWRKQDMGAGPTDPSTYRL